MVNKKATARPKGRALWGTLHYRGNVVADVLGQTFFAQRVYANNVTMVRWVATEATYDEKTQLTTVELDGEEYELGDQA